MNNNNNGSYITGTEQQLHTDIGALLLYVNGVMDDWATQENGRCFIIEESEEKLELGFNNCVGPRCLLRFISQSPYGDSSISDINGRVERRYELIINRGKLLTHPRYSGLVNNIGPSKAFYTLLTSAYDTLRSIVLPGYCFNPVIMGDIHQDGSAEWLMDCYVISFSIICEIGRVQYTPFAPDFVNLSTSASFNPSAPSAL
jgi:hypothetical protein